MYKVKLSELPEVAFDTEAAAVAWFRDHALIPVSGRVSSSSLSSGYPLKQCRLGSGYSLLVVSSISNGDVILNVVEDYGVNTLWNFLQLEIGNSGVKNSDLLLELFHTYGIYSTDKEIDRVEHANLSEGSHSIYSHYSIESGRLVSSVTVSSEGYVTNVALVPAQGTPPKWRSVYVSAYVNDKTLGDSYVGKTVITQDSLTLYWNSIDTLVLIPTNDNEVDTSRFLPA